MTDWLTIDELAKAWRVTPDHVRGLVRSGQLPAVNIARSPGAKRAQWRITPEGLQQFKAARQAVAPAESNGKRKRSRTVRQWV